MSVLQTLAKRIDECDEVEKLDACLEYLPLGEIYANAEADYENAGRSEEDRVVIALLKWFKSHFKWVNAAQCQKCGNPDTKGGRSVRPTPEEFKHQANCVELWHCEKCRFNTRFPRYNDIYKLLETNEGRCGEWCNVMTFLLKAIGREVRYVWNSEDHVWNEVWSESENRWIHVDSCEAAFDKPLIYADGWGKKMAYVIGISNGGLKDITNRYVRREDASLPRTLFKEPELKALLAGMTQEKRQNMDPVEQVKWFVRDETEDKELAQYINATPTNDPDLKPRQSGSAEWTAQRGENGS